LKKRATMKSAMILALLSVLSAGSVKEYKVSCGNGDMMSCYRLGLAYARGDGIEKNMKNGQLFLKFSCDEGIDKACMALKRLQRERYTSPSAHSTKARRLYRGKIDGELQGDLDRDGRVERIVWRKVASTDLGDYYQLLLLDDQGSLIWKGPAKADYENPLLFYSLDFGESLPQLLVDFDLDGYMELLAPAAQSDVSPTYYRKLRWIEGHFEVLPQSALMLASPGSKHFVWKRGENSYGTWVSRMAPYRDGLAKADVTEYHGGEHAGTGVALIRFEHGGAVVSRWIEAMRSADGSGAAGSENLPVQSSAVTGLVHGLDPHGDGFLAIRSRPNGAMIGKLYNGERVEILDMRGGWYKIKESGSGRIGWSYGKWITVN